MNKLNNIDRFGYIGLLFFLVVTFVTHSIVWLIPSALFYGFLCGIEVEKCPKKSNKLEEEKKW